MCYNSEDRHEGIVIQNVYNYYGAPISGTWYLVTGGFNIQQSF
jgi:hypothetical protein